MTLETAIVQWDGKSAEDIAKVYRQYGGANLTADLLPLLLHLELQDGAGWLLKKHLDSGGEINAGQTDRLMAGLSQLQSWQSCLHILQSFHHFRLNDDTRLPVEYFLRRCLADNNKFVRAWSYHGWYYLQAQFPQYSDEVKSFFAMAMRDEAASVKARIRNIAKDHKFSY